MRYLLGRSAIIWDFGWQEEVGVLDVFADSDLGRSVGCRKSTSGGAIMMGLIESKPGVLPRVLWH